MKDALKSHTSTWFSLGGRGFTLLELLVVIGIIVLIAGAGLASMASARESAKVAKTVGFVRQVELTLTQYRLHTGQAPRDCRNQGTGPTSCPESEDPFLNANGVTGWSGPYFKIWDEQHPWGGHIAIQTDGLGGIAVACLAFTEASTYIILEDDRWNLSTVAGNDDGARIPTSALLEIDRVLDDGDLGQGKARGDGACGIAVGELYYAPVLR